MHKASKCISINIRDVVKNTDSFCGSRPADGATSYYSIRGCNLTPGGLLLLACGTVVNSSTSTPALDRLKQSTPYQSTMQNWLIFISSWSAIAVLQLSMWVFFMLSYFQKHKCYVKLYIQIFVVTKSRAHVFHLIGRFSHWSPVPPPPQGVCGIMLMGQQTPALPPLLHTCMRAQNDRQRHILNNSSPFLQYLQMGCEGVPSGWMKSQRALCRQLDRI